MTDKLHQEPLSATRMFDRRTAPTDPITREDMSTLVSEINKRFDTGAAVMREQGATLERLETAMFAKDTDNDFGSRGVMTVMQRLDQHIDTICTFGRWAKNTLTWGVPIVCTVLGLVGQAKGWW